MSHVSKRELSVEYFLIDYNTSESIILITPESEKKIVGPSVIYKQIVQEDTHHFNSLFVNQVF